MSRTEHEFPWRVLTFAGVLFIVVVLVTWAVFFRTPSTVAPGATTPALDPAAAAGTGATEATPTETSGGQQVQELATGGAVAFDPLSPEARAELARIRANAGTMELQLFLIVPGIERLIPVPRSVDAPQGIDAQIKRALQELIEWAGTETVSPLPPQARVREVWVSPGGIAYIDFNTDFYAFSGGGSLGELHTVYSIVTTLTKSFPEILAVQILIDGKVEDTLAGHVDLSMPLVPSADWALIESGDGEPEPGRDSGEGQESGR